MRWLTVVNIGWRPTFFTRERGTIIDVILVSEAASRSFREWRVLTDVENLSDHHHIMFSYSDRTITSNSGAISGSGGAGHRLWGWSTALMDAKLLVTAVVVTEWTGVAWSLELPSQPGDTEIEAKHLIRCVTAPCDVAFSPKTPLPSGRFPIYK